MLDLFNINKTPEERLDSLKEEISTYHRKSEVDTKKTKVKLFYGDIKNFDNGILIISRPPKAKFFESADDKFIISLLDKLSIDKYFITYNYLFFGDRPGPKQIKEFGYFIKKLADIINPKIIVCLGEESQYVFFKRKFLMNDFHGKIIGDYENRPIITTYPISYYEEKSKFEDHSYKDSIRMKDWIAIKSKYEELKC